MRIELFMTLFAGLAGGLCGSLWAGLVTTPLQRRWPWLRPASPSPETASRLLLGAALHGLGGMGAGLLFWLSWGLVAVVAAPWPVLGAGFGLLLWTVGALPALGTLALRNRGGAGAIAATAIEVLVACVAAGVLCAYAWRHGA